MKLSFVIPIYNESNRIEESFRRVKNVLNSLNTKYEIILVDDGSTDNTKNIISKLESINQPVKTIIFDRNRGKGRAIKEGFRISDGDILIFSDADLSADISVLPDMIDRIKNGADICISSRFLKDSKVERSLLREIYSRFYLFLVRFLFSTRISDFQCGFKAFDRGVLPIMLNVRSDGWFWDTELLLTAEDNGFIIDEIPIEWRESSSSPFALFRCSMNMLFNLILFRVRRLNRRGVKIEN